MTRPIPERAKALIKSFEACKLRAYKDVKGVWTIGWGNTRHARQGLVIPQGMADLWFDEDCRLVEREIARVLKPAILDALSDEQYGALASFAFNLGVRPKDHAIWSLINSGKFDDVPGRLLKYNKAEIEGVFIPVAGLTRRRRAEAALWQDDGEEVILTARHAEVTPTQTEKPIVQSKTFWAGATVAAGGAVEGARQVQALVAPQAEAAPLLGHLAQIVAVVIVAGGIAIMVFRWLDGRKRRA